MKTQTHLTRYNLPVFFDHQIFVQKLWGKGWGVHPENMHTTTIADIDLSKVGVYPSLFMSEDGILGTTRRKLILDRSVHKYHPLGIRSFAFLWTHQEMSAPIWDAWREMLVEGDAESISIDGTLLSYHGEPCVAQLRLSKNQELVLFPKSLNEHFGVKELTAICSA